MVVVMVVDAWDQPFNGTVVSTRRFAKALIARGCTVRALALEGQEHPVEGVDLFECPRLSIPGVNGIMDSMRVALARPSRETVARALQGADIVHVQFPLFLGSAAITEAQRHGIPVISSFHVQAENILRNLGLPTGVLAKGVYALMRHFVFARSDLVIAPSVFAERLVQQVGINRPSAVLSNGIPLAQLAAFRERSALPEQVQVLCVGRQAREKRYDIIIDALARVRNPDRFAVTFAGQGPDRARLQERCRQLGINAQFLAPSDTELTALFDRADLFLHAGESELEGMSVMQAMAAGVPTIVSDSDASAAGALTQLPACRFRFPDPADLAHKIDQLIDEPTLVLRASQENAKAMARLGHDASVDRLLSLYGQVAPAFAAQGPINEAA